MSIAHALILTSLALAEPDTGGIPLNPDAEANKGKDMSPLYTMSCANHALQHRGALVQYIDMVSGSYPMIEDARAVFLEVRKRMAKGRTVNKHTNSWLSEYGSACPESYWKDKSIGYIWVGAGLPTKPMEREDPLLFFCPASSHQGSSQHCHAMRGCMDICAKTNAEMIEILKKELQRASKKQIPYTEAAVKKMTAQLLLREKYERQQAAQSKREPERSTEALLPRGPGVPDRPESVMPLE